MSADKRRYRLSPLAEKDLESIWAYGFRTWSSDQADHYHADIIAALEGLMSGRRIGRDASNIRAGYFKYSVGMHILFYRLTSESVDVMRVLHQRMDLLAHLEE